MDLNLSDREAHTTKIETNGAFVHFQCKLGPLSSECRHKEGSQHSRVPVSLGIGVEKRNVGLGGTWTWKMGWKEKKKRMKETQKDTRGLQLDTQFHHRIEGIQNSKKKS